MGRTGGMATQTASLTVTSALMRDGATLPNDMVFNGMGLHGGNKSPDLQWSGAPEGTKSFAITLYDPDAPTTVGFTHWIVFNIPPDVTKIEAGAGSKNGAGIKGAMSGLADYGFSEFGGAAPPPGDPPHHYHLTVYALDTMLEGLDDKTTYAKFNFMIRGHVLAKGTITGTYARS